MLWTVLFLAAWNVLRLISALADWSALADFAPRPGPLYIAITASFWTLACLAVARAIRRRNIHTQGWYILLLLGYIAWWWADRLILFAQPRTNTIFAAVVTAVFILDILGAFFNRKVTTYFTQRDIHDQQPSNQQTT